MKEDPVKEAAFTVVRTCRMVSMCQRWEGAYLTETETHTANSVVNTHTRATASSTHQKREVPQVVE